MAYTIPSVINERVDSFPSHMRDRQPPLFQMPYHMWQPHLHRTNPELNSHCDRAQLGWRKWGAEYPDFYARRAEATHPDWFQRRIDTIRSGDRKECMWPWEGSSKPTERATYGLRDEAPRPWPRGNYQAWPRMIDGQVQMPKWGLYHPHYYQEGGRVQMLPPIHQQDKQNK